MFDIIYLQNNDNFTGSDDVSGYRTSAYFRSGTVVVPLPIYARKDSTFEYDESFSVVAYIPSSPIPSATATVTVQDCKLLCS